MTFPPGTALIPIVLAVGIMVTGSPCTASDSTKPGAFRIDPPTLHSLGFRWYIEGDDNGNARCRVDYRQLGSDIWRPAQPLLRVNRETVDRDFPHYGTNSGTYTVGNLLAGSILFLTPDTAYEIRLQLSDPEGGDARRDMTVRTRGVPVAPEPLRTLHVYPPGFDGDGRLPAYGSLEAALAEAQPGDRILVHEGRHLGGVTLHVSATAAAPIVIRGAGDAVIELAGLDGFNLDLSGSEHVFVEDLALVGGRMGVMARRASHLTVRRCRISGVRYGIFNDREESSHWYIADNVITGIDSTWRPRQQEEAAETGVVVYGRGHVVEHNRISRFWDCLTIADFGRPAGGVEGIDRHCVAVDFNNNDLYNARDDLIETDFGSHNIRVFDNRLYNAHTGVSAQPLYGGPLYFVGNVMYAIVGSAYKFHNWPAGVYVAHNTSITGDIAFMSAPLWQNATLRNNLILGGGSGYTMESGSPDPRTSLDYNGWSRNSFEAGSFIKFTDDGTLTGDLRYRFDSLADFFAGTGNGEHSIIVDMDDFDDARFPSPGATYSPGGQRMTLRAGAAPVDAGVELANITREFTGTAPDMGAYERGQPVPHYGPR